MQRHIDRFRAGKDHVRAVVFIERGENDELISRIRHGHHRRHHGLGAAAGHNDLLIRVNVHPHEMALLFGDPLPEILGAPGDGILVIVLPGDLLQPLQDLMRRIKVRKSLREVHGAVAVGDPGHTADHRVCKSRRAGR